MGRYGLLGEATFFPKSARFFVQNVHASREASMSQERCPTTPLKVGFERTWTKPGAMG